MPSEDGVDLGILVLIQILHVVAESTNDAFVLRQRFAQRLLWMCRAFVPAGPACSECIPEIVANENAAGVLREQWCGKHSASVLTDGDRACTCGIAERSADNCGPQTYEKSHRLLLRRPLIMPLENGRIA